MDAPCAFAEIYMEGNRNNVNLEGVLVVVSVCLCQETLAKDVQPVSTESLPVSCPPNPNYRVESKTQNTMVLAWIIPQSTPHGTISMICSTPSIDHRLLNTATICTQWLIAGQPTSYTNVRRHVRCRTTLGVPNNAPRLRT
jgi:hypothetical protein